MMKNKLFDFLELSMAQVVAPFEAKRYLYAFGIGLDAGVSFFDGYTSRRIVSMMSIYSL